MSTVSVSGFFDVILHLKKKIGGRRTGLMAGARLLVVVG